MLLITSGQLCIGSNHRTISCRRSAELLKAFCIALPLEASCVRMNDEYSISTSNRFAIWFDAEDDPGDEPFSPPADSKKETAKETKLDKNVRPKTKEPQRFLKPVVKQSDEGIKPGKFRRWSGVDVMSDDALASADEGVLWQHCIGV